MRPLDTWSKKEREELYRQTKAEVKNYHHIAQTTRLLKKEKKEREVDEQLRKKRQEIEEKRKVIQVEREDLKQMTTQYNQEIDAKEAVILKLDAEQTLETEKVLKEEAQIKLRTEEIKRKKEELEQVTATLQDTEDKIQMFNRYRVFLKEVVEDSEDFDNIAHLMDRYRTLKNNADKLKLIQKQTEEAANREKLESNKLKKEREEIEMKNTTIRTLEQDIEDQKNKLATLESERESKERQETIKKGIEGKVILSLENIHSKVAELRPGMAKGLRPPEEDPVIQIREIQKSIFELRNIVTEFHNQQKRPGELARPHAEDASAAAGR